MPSYSKDKLGSFLFMIKYSSQGLGFAPLVSLTTNGSILPVPGMTVMSLFQEVIRTNLLRCSAPVTQPILPARSPIWNLLPLSSIKSFPHLQC